MVGTGWEVCGICAHRRWMVDDQAVNKVLFY